MQPISLLLRPEQLLALAKQGDRVALQRLLLAHAADVCAFIRNRLPRAQWGLIDPEDVLQLVFLDAFRDIGTLRGTDESAFRSWLFQIGRNRLQDTLRGAARLKRGGQHLRATTAGRPTDSIHELVELLSHQGRSPSGYVQRDEAIKAVQDAIRNLPADYAQAVQLRFLGGLTLDEVASQMNRSPRSVQGLLDRAKQMMREMLAAEL